MVGTQNQGGGSEQEPDRTGGKPKPHSPARCLACQGELEPEAGEGLCANCLLGKAWAFAADSNEREERDQTLAAASELEGRTLGDYEILQVLARGGMGVVFRARQGKTSRLVALKVISSGELASPAMVQRFHNEARAAARLQHPHIVPIFEVGEDRGWHFFSMALVVGQTLGDRLAAGRPKPKAAVELLRKIARAVEHAHQRGILHRDLKPTNILLDAAGEPHLTDFGLAKVLENDSELTATHALLGTPAYMSPEQAQGRTHAISTATDVYGLGAMFYEMLTGRPPFSAPSVPALLRKITEEEPGAFPQVSGQAAVPRDLEVICRHCLRKDPARRYATAGELAEELDRWCRNEPIRARPAGAGERLGKWVRRHPARATFWGAVASGLLLVIGGGMMVNTRLELARRRAESSALENRQSLVRQQLRESSRLIGEGRAFEGAWPALMALQIDGENPDTARAARRRLGGIFQFSPRLLRLWHPAVRVEGLQFSEDGALLAALDGLGQREGWMLLENRPAAAAELAARALSATGQLTVTNLRSATLQKKAVLGAFRSDLGEDNQSSVSITLVSPDGNWLATAGFDTSIKVIRRSDGMRVGAVLAHPAPVAALAFSPDNRFLAVGCADGLVRVWDWAEPLGEMLEYPLPVDRPIFLSHQPGIILQTATNQLSLIDPLSGRLIAGPFAIPNEPQMIVRSADGRWLAASCANGFLGLWDSNSGRLVWQRQLSPAWCSLDFSPDNTRLAALEGNEGALHCLRIADGADLFPAGEIKARSRRVEWSPDGRWVLTTSQNGLRVWDAGTWTQSGETLAGEENVYTARFSPDSRKLAASFAGSEAFPGVARIWGLPGLERIGLPLSHGDALREIRFSADSRLVVTTGLDHSVRLWRADSGRPATPPMRHENTASVADFGDRGELLITGGADKTVRLWETATGGGLALPILLPGPVHDVGLDASGQILAIRDNGWPGWLFRFQPDGRSLAELKDLARLTTGVEADQGGALRAIAADELARSFNAWRERDPATFAWPTNAARWHEQTARLAEQVRDGNVAAFHLRRLLALHPEDAQLKERLAVAEAHP